MTVYTIQTGVSDNATDNNNSRSLARSQNGDLHAVYQKSDGTRLQIYYAMSGDGGATWNETQITSENYDQYYPSIAIDSNDYFHVVWCGKHTTSTQYQQLRYVKYITSWSAISNLTVGNYHQYRPAVAVDSSDYIHVAWDGTNSTDPIYNQLRYIKNTGSWGSVEDLTTGSYYQYRPAIAIDSSDYIHVAWDGKHSGSTTYYQIRYIKYSSGSWSAISNLTSANYFQFRPAIAIDSSDYLHVAWQGQSADNANYQIRYIKYTGSWSAITNLSDDSYDQTLPSIAIDSSDYLHVAWSGKHTGSTTYYQIRYIKYSSGSWSAISNLTSASANQYWASLIWAPEPTFGGSKTNRTKDGYVFTWTDLTSTNSVKLYVSADLDWDVLQYNVSVSISQVVSMATGSEATATGSLTMPVICSVVSIADATAEGAASFSQIIELDVSAKGEITAVQVLGIIEVGDVAATCSLDTPIVCGFVSEYTLGLPALPYRVLYVKGDVRRLYILEDKRTLIIFTENRSLSI